MKLLFTLLFSCFISMGLIGQHDIQDLKDFKDLKEQRISKKQHHGINALENQRPRNPEYASRNLIRQFRVVQGITLKASLVAGQKLDSLLGEFYDATQSHWALSDRELFTYDEQGNMVTYVWYAFDNTEMKMLPVDKETVKHNAQGQPTEIIWLIWDTESGQWLNWGRFELSYDESWNLTKEIISDWDPEANQWHVGVQFEMTHDGQGEILSELWSFWDEESSALVETYKDEYIYEDGLLTTLNEYGWEEGEWIIFFRTTSVYDTSGNLIEEFKQFWDSSSELWFDFSKSLFTYNDSDQLIMEEDWEFDLEEKFMMVLTWQYNFVWDSDGNLIEQVDKSWEEEIVKGTKTWLNDLKSEWTYNKDFTISDIYAPYWFQDIDNLNFVHMPDSETESIYVDGDWVVDYRQQAYYSDFGASTGIKDVHALHIKVFPIPAAEQITFSWEDSQASFELELYDLTGKRVISRSIDHNEIIGVDQLPGGIYLYKLIDNNHLIHSGKISIE